MKDKEEQDLDSPLAEDDIIEEMAIPDVPTEIHSKNDFDEEESEVQ